MQLDTNNYYNDLSTKFANLGATKIVGTHIKVEITSYNSGSRGFVFNGNSKAIPYVCATIEHEWVDVLKCTITACSTSSVNVKVYNGSTQNMNDVIVHVIAVGYI